MIRLIYWTLALIELILLLTVVLIFIITDSRTIKYAAETSLDPSVYTYESIEGNLFQGLEVRNLRYKNKSLFSSALIHWNPLTLFYDKVTITQLDAQGVELENILQMVKDLKSGSSDETMALGLDLSINVSHFDINPYIYEEVKFSSFVFETGKIEVTKDLIINTGLLYLKFDSDIVNATLDGKVVDSRLFVNKLDLHNISEDDITNLTRRLKRKYSNDENSSEVVFSKEEISQPLLKEIQVKHILGTMKPIQYGDLKIKSAQLDLYNGRVDPSDNFEYQVEKLDFKGETNFGKVSYKGDIQDSTIYAKGNIVLDKELFRKYELDLNFKGLKRLPSTIRLNHDAVWIDINHKVDRLLELNHAFNLDVNKAEHKLHYNYDEEIFSIVSDVDGSMTYANKFKLNNRVEITEESFFYKGKVMASNSKELPLFITDYLVPNLEGEFKGDSDKFEMDLNSKFLEGVFKLRDYRHGELIAKSKEQNIELQKIVAVIPDAFKNELIGLRSENTFDFDMLTNSKLDLMLFSDNINLDAKMALKKPYKVDFRTYIQKNNFFKSINNKINFSEFKELNGEIELFPNHYLLTLANKHLKLFLEYDFNNQSIKEGIFRIDNHSFNFQKNYQNALSLNTRVTDIKALFENIKRYYDIDLPNLEGSVDLKLVRDSNEKLSVTLNSPKIEYISDGKAYDIDNLEIEFTIDAQSNIVLNSYKFRSDNNEYLNTFYSNNPSHFRLKNGKVYIEKFWLNDKVLITGEYHFLSAKGDLKVDAKSFNFHNKNLGLNLDLDLDLGVKIRDEKFDISGNANILGGKITYELSGSDIVEDADIIIMEEVAQVKKSLLNNVKLYIKVKSKEPLDYRAEEVNIKFSSEIAIVKAYDKKMLVTGVSNIKNGYYVLDGKKFVLDNSHLYFTGDFRTPLLDLKASYKKDEYIVSIFISGTTDAPIVNFNSDPHLTQQEILSLILFDGTGSSSGKGAEAYTLLGGSFAKGLIKSLGIDVDHLLLGTDAEEQLSLEIGRKISDDISVLYLHKDGLDGAKVRIEHSDRFETDIIIQPPNTSSIEFLYKRDR